MKTTNVNAPKKVAAPGELYNATYDNGNPTYVTNTEQIYDYSQEKSQEDFNIEVAQAILDLQNNPQTGGCSEEEVNSLISDRLNNLNSTNSGQLGESVSALAAAVGNKPSNKEDHETRIQTLEVKIENQPSNTDVYTTEEVDQKIEGVRNSIGTLSNGVSTSIDGINTEINTINTEIGYLTTAVTQSLPNDISTLSDNTSASLTDLKKRITVEFYGTLDSTGISISSTYNNSTSNRVYYLSDRKTFVSGLAGATLLYKDWAGRFLYTEEPGGTPYSSKVYVCKGICYGWDKDAQELKTIEGSIDPGTSPVTPAQPQDNRASFDDLDTITDTSEGTRYDVTL